MVGMPVGDEHRGYLAPSGQGVGDSLPDSLRLVVVQAGIDGAPAVAVGMLHVAFVDEPGAIADARILVDDHPIEHDVTADAKHRAVAARGRVAFRLVVICAEHDRARDPGPTIDALPDSHHRMREVAVVHETALGHERLTNRAPVVARRRQEPRVRVDRPVRIVEVERRAGRRDCGSQRSRRLRQPSRGSRGAR